MAIFRRDKRPVKRDPMEAAPDPRIWGRSYRGPAPWIWGLILVVVIGFGVYYAFAKQIPFVGPGYELHAKFANAATLRPDSPVRIAGVNVGKVTGVSAAGDAADVTFTVEDQGRPIHADATVEIRPRLFLEGNFFLDLDPGTPGAEELDGGDTIPVSQTATAVQIDEVLTALQQPDRKGLQKALDGFATGLTHVPTAAEDVGQDPDVQGKTGAEALQGALRYGGPAGRDTSIVNQALLGNGPHDLSELIRALRATFGKLESHEPELQELITNFNVTTGALAAESTNLSETIAELPPTLETARPSLAELSDSLPAVRALAIELRPSIAELPATIDAANPWLDQARPLLTDAELGGLSRLLERATPPLASVAVDSAGLFDETHDFARCTSENLVPTGDIVIDNNGGAYPFGDGAARLSVRRLELAGVPLLARQPVRRGPGLRRQRLLAAGQRRRRQRALEHPVSRRPGPQQRPLRQQPGGARSGRGRRSRRRSRRIARRSPARPTRCPTSTARAAPACPATSVPPSPAAVP